MKKTTKAGKPAKKLVITKKISLDVKTGVQAGHMMLPPGTKP
jgi:hypothetical protein